MRSLSNWSVEDPWLILIRAEDKACTALQRVKLNEWQWISYYEYTRNILLSQFNQQRTNYLNILIMNTLKERSIALDLVSDLHLKRSLITSPSNSFEFINKSLYDHYGIYKIHLFISKSDLNYSSCQFFICTMPFQQLLPSFGFLEHSQAWWSLPSDCEELIDHSPNPYTKHNTELASVDTAAAVPACRVRQREAERHQTILRAARLQMLKMFYGFYFDVATIAVFGCFCGN